MSFLGLGLKTGDGRVAFIEEADSDSNLSGVHESQGLHGAYDLEGVNKR